jgi:hypothetical protein
VSTPSPSMLERATRLLKPVAFVALTFVTVVVLLDIFGVIHPFSSSGDTTARPARLPAEFLYLDDERVDAYLSQLSGGLAETEARTSSTTRSRRGSLGAQEVVQLGGEFTEHETVQQTVLPRAADRYYMLETQLASQFGQTSGGELFAQEPANRAPGCTRIANPKAIHDGQFIRFTGARVRVPTYALALAKVAHAEPFLVPAQGPHIRSADGLSDFRTRLSALAARSRKPLRTYVKTFGRDPRIPFRLEVPAASGDPCQVFLPIRYSKLTEAPSLLTGYITVVGKVIRRLTKREPLYYDAETVVTYGRALRQARPNVRDALAVNGKAGSEAVVASATTEYPGLVVLPLAMYK